MANQSGWSNEHRDFGGYEGGRGRQARDERDDYEGQASGYSRYDRRDDYRYGGGSSLDYGYGRNNSSSGAGGYQSEGRDDGRYGRGDQGGYRGASSNYGERSYGGGRYGNESYMDDYAYGAYGEFGGYGQGGGYSRGAYAQSGYGHDRNAQDRRYGRDYGYGANRYGRSGYSGSDYGRAAAYGYGYDDRFGQGQSYQAAEHRRAQEPRSWFDKTSDEVSSWFGDDDAARRRRQDELRTGQHRGRGPSDYTRSDERIREDVNDRLTDDPHIDATAIQVQIKGGEITLSGTVKSRNDKRHAEDLAESVSGVKHVQNNLRVHDTNYDAQLSQSGSTTGSATASGVAGSTSTTRTN